MVKIVYRIRRMIDRYRRIETYKEIKVPPTPTLTPDIYRYIKKDIFLTILLFVKIRILKWRKLL